MDAILPISMLAGALTASSVLYFRLNHKAKCPRCDQPLQIEPKQKMSARIIYYCHSCNKRFTNGNDE